jgi:hypothetical protein
MISNIRIATWNLCLGLAGKKNLVKNYINENKVDICCLQEIELDSDFDQELLSFPNYCLEVEQNDVKRRVAIYIRSTINYRRRHDLEGSNSHLVVVDLYGSPEMRIISIYRSFRPQENITAREKFKYQLDLIKASATIKCIILGDFNIDHSRKYDVSYANKQLFADFDDKLSHLGLFQHVNFPTWSRTVNGTHKESILDHIYSNNLTFMHDIRSVVPIFGDHLLIFFDLSLTNKNKNVMWKRDWRLYSKEALCNELSAVNWNINVPDVQQFWNLFECLLLGVVDKIVPCRKFCNNEVLQSNPHPKIKTLQNSRKNLLKKFKSRPSDTLKLKIKQFDNDIKKYFYHQKCKKVRRGIIPGNSKSLWTAVRIAKDQNTECFPKVVFENGVKIPEDNIPDAFAAFFDSKVKTLVQDTLIDPNIYNGRSKIQSLDCFFMGEEAILDCVKTLKVKNCEGYDRLPQRVLKDGIDYLIYPFTFLFKSIYNTKLIPDQWKIAKVNPIPKKGSKSEISNYRPISSLCTVSKIFEKLILKQLIHLQDEKGVDFTGKQQHGFKKNKSTASAGLVLQSIIAKHVDSNEIVVMASLDLSAAFDMVNVDLLIKRLRILGIPSDLIDLVRVWLSDRSFYVSINGDNSILFELVCGTVQGSILGPILYAIYVSPLFDLQDLTNFADDNFIIRWNSYMPALVVELELSLEAITSWLRGSGLSVNESKTEVCLFHRLDQPLIKIKLFNSVIKSQYSMNVLGVIFDSKLQWSAQVSKTILKANRALHAIKLIKTFFTQYELRTLLTANFYSILYYNSEIWHIPNLNPNSKQHLLAASAKALKLCDNTYSPFQSFIDLHRSHTRATPFQFSIYKHALLLFKLYNSNELSDDWVSLNFNQILTGRQLNFKIFSTNNFKIGSNLLCNRLSCLNDLLPLSWLALSLDSFKIKCKERFLL